MSIRNILLILIIIFSIFVSIQIPKVSETSTKPATQSHQVNKISDSVLNPITINSNSDFRYYARINGWKGNGTRANPFIIENLIIQSNTSTAILITETTVFFIIKNCTVSSKAGHSLDTGGIALRDVSNGLLINNTAFNNNEFGISLFYTHNFNITDNLIYNNKFAGIQIAASNKTLVTNNVVKTNNIGIYIPGEGSNLNIIADNVIESNRFGLRIEDNSNYNDIVGNLIQKNSEDGLKIIGTRSNLVSNNTFQENLGYGINIINTASPIYPTANNTVKFNNFYNSTNQAFCNDTTNLFLQNYWSTSLVGAPYAIAGNAVYDNKPAKKPNQINISSDQINLLLQQQNLITITPLTTRYSLTSSPHIEIVNFVIEYFIIIILILISFFFLIKLKSKIDPNNSSKVEILSNNQISDVVLCPNCYFEVSRDDKFCINCGKKIDD